MVKQIIDEFEQVINQITEAIRLDALKSGLQIDCELGWTKEYCPSCKCPGFHLGHINGQAIKLNMSACYIPEHSTIVYYSLCKNCDKKLTSPKQRLKVEKKVVAEVRRIMF